MIDKSSSNHNKWDWASFADESGFVDVIVITNDGGSSGNPISSVMGKISEKAKDSESASKHKKLLDEMSLISKKKFTHTLTGFSAQLTLESVQTLSALDSSVSVYPDLEVQAYVSYNIRQVGADRIWTRTDSYGKAVEGYGITVAVIDTGIDYTHPDLGGGFGQGYKVVGGYDFYNSDSDPMDDNGHGTHVAGIIGANGASFKGVAPGAQLLAYKVLGAGGSGSTSKVIEAIDRALDPNNDGDTSDHVDVISMSLGGPGNEDDPLAQATNAAVDAGVVVVAAAGNDGPTFGTVGSPATAAKAISVGAIDGNNKLASFSSRGTSTKSTIKPEICAPGVYISSTVPRSGTSYSDPSGYRLMSGTSMAAPHISGAAALLIQLHPDWTPQKVKSALISGANASTESIWFAGSGNVWLPNSADTTIFVTEPIVSLGIAASGYTSLVVRNSGSTATFSVNSKDWHSLTYNGSTVAKSWVNLSSVQPTSFQVSSGASYTMTVSVDSPLSSAPEGYYEGEIHVTDGVRDVRVPIGYFVLSRLNVHVLDMSGNEVFDQYGLVALYNLPDADISLIASSDYGPSPPASFLVPSGSYSIHAAGHKILYRYNDPYILSDTVALPRMETREVYLSMVAARQLTLGLATDEGVPIYVKDYRVFIQYVAKNSFSTDMSTSDYSMTAEDLQYLAQSKKVYVSDTNATIGISIVGYSYTSSMWDFMMRNRGSWHQFSGKSSTSFYIESTCDLQYFLAWELDGVGASTPTTLSLEAGKHSTYYTKYDTSGAIRSYTGNWGITVSMGGLTTLYVRRDTDAPINPFFTGMTRTTFVQGVFSEIYIPGDIYDESVERQFFVADYNHVKNVLPSQGIYLPERAYLTPIVGVTESERLGAGPFYPSVWTSNTNTSMVLHQPLLRDQSGSKVIEILFPTMKLYRDGASVYSGDVYEFMARPDAYRVMSLASSGFYTLEIDSVASPQICNSVKTILGFRLPGLDVDPPEIVGLNMSQRFVPGQATPIEMTVTDASTIGSVELSWRSKTTSSWQSLSVSNLGGGKYRASIVTALGDLAINLKAKVLDSYGNYIEYYASNASLKQIPVTLTLFSDAQFIEYKNSETVVVLTGHLTDESGSALSSGYSVPLELILNGKKVALLLDDYVVSGVRTHNGAIRFEWHLNPTLLFSGPNEDAIIKINFDMGIYSPVSTTFTLKSIVSSSKPPTITLQSPANGSLMAAGQVVDMDIVDDGTFSANAYLDGVKIASFASPWQITTTSWSDGSHVLEIVATDNEGLTTTSYFVFEVDAIAPSVTITYPIDGGRIPVDSVLMADVSDARLASVAYSADGKPSVPMSYPYDISLSGWSTGQHVVSIAATDQVSHSTTRQVSFEITASSVILQLLSPASGSVVRSGTIIQLAAYGNGSMTLRWYESGTWNDLGSQTAISTAGWQQGLHNLVINVTSSLGGYDQIIVVITIDDIAPAVQLQSPVNGSYVSPTDSVIVHVEESNPAMVEWTLWGVTSNSSSVDVSIPLTSSAGDGAFLISVRAIDKAGNEVTVAFAFNLDSSPPVLLISNLISGEVARKGSVLHITAIDPYLTFVEWILDDGQSIVLPAPHDIDTSSFSGGWHSLKVVASDSSGKQAVLSVSFYLDSASPAIGSLSSTSYETGSDFSVTVSVTDDYGVGQVLLYYELEDGSYGSTSMALDQGSYVAVLPADSLWDGMDVYVACKDIAGNDALGPLVQLSGTTSRQGGLNLGFLSSFSGIALIVVVAMISSISMLYVSKRKGKDDEQEPEMDAREPAPQPAERHEHVPMPTPAPLIPQPTRSPPLVRTARMERKLAEPKPARDPMDELIEEFLKEPPKLVDSIPKIMIRDEEEEEKQKPYSDYGDLIEKELIIPGLKNSVYKNDVQDLSVELDLQLAELKAMIKDRPKKPYE